MGGGFSFPGNLRGTAKVIETADKIVRTLLVEGVDNFTEGDMKTLKELQREIRQTIRQLEETASKSEVFIEAEDNIAIETFLPPNSGRPAIVSMWAGAIWLMHEKL